MITAARWRSACFALMFLVSLAHCGSGQDPEKIDGALGDVLTLTGPISNWTGGDGYTLEARLEPPDAAAMVVKSLPLDAAGNFSFTLSGSDAAPYLAAGEPYKVDSCVGSAQYNPPMVRHAHLQLSATTASASTSVNQEGTMPIDATSRVDYFVIYYYFDTDLSITGELPCGNVTFIYKVTARAGWNRLILKVTAMNLTTKPTGTYELYVGGLPEGVSWLAAN